MAIGLNCSYSCPFHKGKIEWHHPCAKYLNVGLFLCEAHHSLLQGRHTRYRGEMIIDKTLQQMKTDIQSLERQIIEDAGLDYGSIDKR